MTFQLLLSLSIASGSVYAAQDWDSLEGALGSEGWGDEITGTTEPGDSSSQETTVGRDQTQSAPKPCTRDDQTSMPHKTFLKLLDKKKLSINHSASRKSLTLDGGTMIGNCNEMLSFDFAHPTDDLPYIFQVNFKRPAGCNGDKCNYNVYTADGGVTNSQTESKSYSPNYDGFLSCLKDSGVLKNGKFATDKIAKVPFNKQYSDIDGGANFWFASHGPKPGKRGVYSKNKRPRMGCYFFEDIQKGGKRLYTAAENEMNIKQDQFQATCKLKSYQQITDKLPSFGNFREMQMSLVKIRDGLLLNEVKEVHELLKGNDLSEVDISYVSKIINDYNRILIQPKRKKIAKLYEQIRKMKKGSERSRAIKLLNRRVNELVKLAKAPYVNGDNYDAMIDFAKKSPLHEEEWRSAALTLFTANTTAYNYERYRKGSELPEARPAAVNREVNAAIREEKKDIQMRGEVASNPNKSYAAEYAAKSQNYIKAQSDNLVQLQQYTAQEYQRAQNYCMDPRKYWLNRQRCIAEAQQRVAYAGEDVTNYNRGLDVKISALNQKSSYWGGLEAQKWGSSRPSVSSVNPGNGQVPAAYNFTFDPGKYRVPAGQNSGATLENPNTQLGFDPNNPNTQMTPEVAAYFRQQQALRYSPPSASAGWNYNYRASVGNNNAARQPAYTVPAVQQPMMPYANQQTGPTGQYNF